jgi:hypothetical protein
LSEQRVSVEEKLRRQLVMEVFCTEKRVEYHFETIAKNQKKYIRWGVSDSVGDTEWFIPEKMRIRKL